jgi:hypothetical protein
MRPLTHVLMSVTVVVQALVQLGSLSGGCISTRLSEPLCSHRPGTKGGHVTEAREEDVIRQLEDRRYDAVVAGDFTAFEALCHPELTYTHSTAVVDSLESYLRKCHDGHYDYHSIEHPVSAVRIIGDTALVFGEMKADLTAGGVRKQLDNLSLRLSSCLRTPPAVWTKLDGEWKLLAFQPTVKPGA